MIKTFENEEQLNRFAAKKFAEFADAAIDNKGSFAVALAGGSTPKSLYQLLTSGEYKNKIDWSQAFFFFGDERNVAPDDAESNYRMARENLFEPLKIAETNVFRWQTEIGDVREIADQYEKSLKGFFQTILPRFDLIVLGMGGDGHTASLFPFTEALNEKEQIAVANRVEKLKATRLTLTFPVINNARNVVFLVRGADKAETLRAVLEGEFEPEKFPAQLVKPANGELLWLVDAAAARLLDG